ncbi:PUA-like domain-containing protein [Flagelloscypha sp. PMI_526]|nr:PUA-like domain-containing protein [Flagelloscypha sp. PMI_526]
MSPKYWLLKAEPDSRIVKEKDVKFSVDDFEKIGTSSWDGVRNHRAKNNMKAMTVGDEVLFYHSNCKIPGIQHIYSIDNMTYNEFRSHPYYDEKTDPENPRWFMVDLTFKRRAKHFIPLALMKLLATSTSLPSELDYIGESGFSAIKGRSDQPCPSSLLDRFQEEAWNAVKLLADRGGWDELEFKGSPATQKRGPKKRKAEKTEEAEEMVEAEETTETKGKRRKTSTNDDLEPKRRRRSGRTNNTS